MSENITHYAVCDDALRLMRAMPWANAAFVAATHAHPDLARMGAVTRGTDRFNPPLLRRIRDGWEGRRPEEQLEAKLAYSLGALCHRAADRTFKPVFDRLAPEDSSKPRTVSIYHDVFLFREVYNEGREAPYAASLFTTESAFEEHLRVLLQRALIGLHTFIPDQEDPEGWLERLFALRQTFRVEVSRYTEAYCRPDPVLLDRYIVAPRFYDAGDDLVRLARALQRGQGADPAEVQWAWEAAGARQSQYAQALAWGVGYLWAAHRYFIGELSDEELSAALDIGRPDR